MMIKSPLTPLYKRGGYLLYTLKGTKHKEGRMRRVFLNSDES